MKTKLSLFILIFIGMTFLLVSCTKSEIEDEAYNATVIGKGLDCGNSFLIKFNKDVSGLPNNTFDNTYYEINLPQKYKVEGMKIKVEFREPTNNELIVCTDMGISYPQIYIIKVD